MNSNTLYTPDAAVIEAVEHGLLQSPKRLPSWLFYDEAGDKLFQEIMALPAYYLTRCEFEILKTHKDALLHHFMADQSHFDLVELGAGDGTKTELLLRHMVAAKASFAYRPVDISEAVLKQMNERLSKSLPALDMQPIVGRYEDVQMHLNPHERKVLLFMGANIGNFEWTEAVQFLQSISAQMQLGDMLLVGFDLKKNPETILAAYDDTQGVTEQFNLNVLTRLNRELGAQFDTSQFEHHATYDESTGETRSYLVSVQPQEVYIEEMNSLVCFDKDEAIHMEISLKYNQSMIEFLAENAGLQIIDQMYDSNAQFCNVLFRTVK